MLLKTDAVVLKQTKFGEGDMILTLFSKKLGKLQAVAKGSRKPRGRYSIGTQLFCYGEFVLYKGRDLYQISQVDMKESFYRLREDVIKLSYASYVLELTASVIIEGQTNNRLFDLLLECLNILSSSTGDHDTIIKAYELKLLTYIGFKPELSCCAGCRKIPDGKIKFSSSEGGLLCMNCFEKDLYAMQISPVTINVMNYLIHADLSKLSRLKIKPNALQELNKIIKQYIYTYIDKASFKSLEFLNTIKY